PLLLLVGGTRAGRMGGRRRAPGPGRPGPLLEPRARGDAGGGAGRGGGAFGRARSAAPPGRRRRPRRGRGVLRALRRPHGGAGPAALGRRGTGARGLAVGLGRGPPAGAGRAGAVGAARDRPRLPRPPAPEGWRSLRPAPGRVLGR